MDACETSLKVLVVSPRCPWTGHTGDRLRVRVWIEALAPAASVVLIAPDRGAPHPSGIEYIRARWSPLRFLRDAIAAAISGVPMQTVLTAGYGWQSLIDDTVKTHGPFDASIVVLSRLDAWLRRAPRAKVKILDAVDSLTMSMRERAREAHVAMKWIWKREERLTAALESSIASRYDRVIVVSAEEQTLFGGPADVISNGVRVSPEPVEERDFDCGFWGRLAYFANHDAAIALVEHIWPAIRKQHPQARLVIAGAEAPKRIRDFNGRDGITVVSPVEDMAKLARRVKVAVFPVRFGTGQANKVLEAAEAGCAIVAAPEAVRGLPELAASYRSEHDLDRLAAHAAELLTDDGKRRQLGEAARAVVIKHYSREQTMRQMRDIAGVSALGPRPSALGSERPAFGADSSTTISDSAGTKVSEGRGPRAEGHNEGQNEEPKLR